MSPPRPRQQRRLHASHLQICEFRMPYNAFFTFLLPHSPLFFQNYIFLIKMDPPSLQLCESVRFFRTYCTHVCSKTIASAERTDKRPLPTDHNANLHQKCKLEDAPVMILMLEVTIRLTILKPASHTYVLLTLPARYIACMSSCFRPLATRRYRIACFLSPTWN